MARKRKRRERGNEKTRGGRSWRKKRDEEKGEEKGEERGW